MPKRLNLRLSSKGVESLLNKLDKLEVVVEEAKQVSIKEVVEVAEELVKVNTPVDMRDTVNSTKIEIDNKKYSIVQEGDHVFENEFGDGYYGREIAPYPGELPAGFRYTHQFDYYFYPERGSKYYKDGRKVHSEGQVASAQMYYGAQLIREELPEHMKKKVRDNLSKI